MSNGTDTEVNFGEDLNFIKKGTVLDFQKDLIVFKTQQGEIKLFQIKPNAGQKWQEIIEKTDSSTDAPTATPAEVPTLAPNAEVPTLAPNETNETLQPSTSPTKALPDSEDGLETYQIALFAVLGAGFVVAVWRQFFRRDGYEGVKDKNIAQAELVSSPVTVVGIESADGVVQSLTTSASDPEIVLETVEPLEELDKSDYRI